MGMVARWAIRLLDLLVGLVFLAIIVITLVQVALRYLAGGALVWSEELNLLLWVWMIQLGAIKATHMRIELVSEALPRTGRLVLVLVLAAISLALVALLTWGGIRMMELTRFDHYIAIPWLSVKYSYLALVVAGPLWMLAIIAEAARALRLEEGVRPA